MAWYFPTELLMLAVRVTWGLSRLNVKFHFLFLCYCCSACNTTTLFCHNVSCRLEGKEMWPGREREMCRVCDRVCPVWVKKCLKNTDSTGLGVVNWHMANMGQAGTNTQESSKAHPQRQKKSLNFIPHLILFYRACPIAALVQTPGRQTCYFSTCSIVWKCLVGEHRTDFSIFTKALIIIANRHNRLHCVMWWRKSPGRL